MTKWNELYKYPASTRSLIDGKRHYAVGETEDGQKLPSVTTILSATQSEEKRESLANWRQKVGEKEANAIMNDAAKRGTAMHSYLENYLLSLKTGRRKLDLTDIGIQARIMGEEIIKQGFGDLNEVWGVEATLYYPERYAGTTDLCGRYKGKDSILDFKQTNKPKREEWIEDYFIQLAAYAMAHNKVYDTKIDQGVVLMCSKDGYFQKFMVEGQRFMDFKDKWKRKLDEYYSKIDRSKIDKRTL